MRFSQTQVTFAVSVLVCTLAGGPVARAQGGATGDRPGAARQEATPSSTGRAAPSRADSDKRPVNVDRIARKLKAADPSGGLFAGTRLEYFLSVYAQAPAISVFTQGESQTTGPVKNSAPSHQEFLNFWGAWRTGRR